MTYGEIYNDSESQFWEDLAQLIETEGMSADRIRKRLLFEELEKPDAADFMEDLEAKIGQAQLVYKLVMSKMPAREYTHVEDGEIDESVISS